jgi:hypothetical protein
VDNEPLGRALEPTDDRPPRVDTVVRGRWHLPTDDAALLAELPAARRADLLASVAVLVPEVGDRAGAMVDAVLEWSPPELRVDVIGCDPQCFPSGTAVGTPDGGPVLRPVVDPLGGRRVDRLDTLMGAVAESELIVVPPRVPPRVSPADLGRVVDGIGHLWVTGADIALVPAAGTSASLADPGTAPGIDAAIDAGSRLSRALGLVSGHPGSLVVVRRWTARWLFDGVSGAMEPVRELQQRSADLAVGMIEVLGS